MLSRGKVLCLTHLFFLLFHVSSYAREETILDEEVKGRIKEQTETTRTRQLRGKCSKDMVWESKQGQLFLNNNPFHLKGTSWFGLETSLFHPHGLWGVEMRGVFTFLQENQFNALRLPFSAHAALNLDMVMPDYTNFVENHLKDYTVKDIMVKTVDLAAEYGILIMWDLHCLDPNIIPELWYNSDISEKDVIQAWDNMLDLFESKWNVFALDIKNEPHGHATWGSGDRDTDWNSAAERICKHLIRNHPEYKGLFFIEGVQIPYSESREIDPHHKWWGGDLEGVHDYPIRLGNMAWDKRVVYSPHVYGPDVFLQDFFDHDEFPHNLSNIWKNQWAFAEYSTNRAIVVGEWGGYNRGGTIDRTWHERFAKFLVQNCLEDNFYWCLNPNSGDTGGLLDHDFKTPNLDKLRILRYVQPNPSQFQLQGDLICVNGGAYSNRNCKTHQPSLNLKL